MTAQVVDSSPMVTLRKPRVQEPPVPVVSQDDFRAVLDTCRRDFLGLRDAALLHLFHSTGGRLSELADLHLHNLDEDRVSVLGKGGRHRILPVSPSTKQALGSYLGARARHPYASLPWLWLSKEGHFTGLGHPANDGREMREGGCHPLPPSPAATHLRPRLAVRGG